MSSTFKIEKLDLLISVYIFCICVAELMGAKTFPLVNLFGYQLNSTVALFVFPLTFTINDMVVEVYGKERARSIVRSGLIVVFFILVFSLFATSLPPTARFATSENAYDTVFHLSARISFASLVAFALSEFSDIYIFVYLRKALGKKALWLRNNASNFLSQLIDTTLFVTLAFYALDKPVAANASFLISLIFPYWAIKCVASVIETPLVYAGVKWLKSDKK